MRLALTVQSLVENFTHIGFQRSATNHAYRFYLLGQHSNISIINPARTAFALRKLSLILLRVFVRRYKTCFITHKLPTRLDGRNLFFNQQYCLDY
jgi:ribosomal protein S2